jgi:hypothetical protein
MNILDKAQEILNSNRNTNSGNPVMNLNRLATMANLMGANVTALDCVNVLIALNLSSESHGHKEDNLTNAAAYLEIKRMIIESQNKVEED